MNNLYKKIALISLGCKVNQAEINTIREELGKYKAQIVDKPGNAELVIVNTCAVTKKAEEDGRKLLAKLAKSGKTVVATGCLAELMKDSLKAEGVSIIVGNGIKNELPALLDLPENESLTQKKGQTRYFIKIQDGCDCYCSYCIIPFLRGAPSSTLQADVINEFKLAVSQGYKELVLTGIHIGLYGKTEKGSSGLCTLLKELSLIPGDFRIRLTSLYVQEITDELIELVANNPKLTPHFHISLQSGSDEVLSLMNRNYTGGDFLKVVKKIRSRMPDAFIGIDIIAGFPGETDELFHKTVSFLEELPFELMLDNMHIFPYSRRPGTKAADYSGQVSSADKKARVKMLRTIAGVQSGLRQQNMLGKRVRVLSEKDGKGHAENFHLIHLQENTPANRFYDVTVARLLNGRLYADMSTNGRKNG